MTTDSHFEQRKKEHIQHSLKQDAESLAQEDWDRIFLIPEALPEMDLSECSIEVESLGRRWKNPYFISSMTAGVSESHKINSILAEACAHEGWLMGVGSQRKELSVESASQEWKDIRRAHPKVMLASNIGLSQLIQSSISDIQKLIESTEAALLFVHTNPLQECLQREGTPQFRGGLEALEKLTQKLSIPVVVKEVGSGIAPKTIQRLKEIGVSAVDLSGRGGTHWGRVEGLRAPTESLQAKAAQTFQDWGLSTPRALYQWHHYEHRIDHKMELWASGGIRNGLQAAKAIALGAQRVGLAKPFLEAALKGVDSVKELMTLLEYELKVSLFCTGMKNIAELKDPPAGRKVWLWEME